MSVKDRIAALNNKTNPNEEVKSTRAPINIYEERKNSAQNDEQPNQPMSIKDRIALMNQQKETSKTDTYVPGRLAPKTNNSPSQPQVQPQAKLEVQNESKNIKSLQEKFGNTINQREETSKTDTYVPGRLAQKTNNSPSQPQVQPQAKLEVQNESKNIKSLQEKLGNIQFHPQNPNLLPKPASKPPEANIPSEAIEIAMQKPLRQRNPPKSVNFDF